jgi:iron complex transport system ATP-binding protein
MVLALESVTFRRSGTEILRGIDWEVRAGEHWAILGPNGAGKTTLLRIAAARSHPTTGSVSVLDRRLGRTPVAQLHERIGFVEPRLARTFHPKRLAREVVLTGTAGTIALLDRQEPERADELIALLGIEHVRERAFGDCSEGERARVLLARALMLEPALLLLDEPTAGLDLPGREVVLAAIRRLVAAHPTLASVTVTHHVEELAASTTHALLLREGAVVASGPIDEVVAAGPLSACFGIPIRVESSDGRFLAVAATDGKRA